MAIEKRKIEAIKHGVDLVALVEAKGIDQKGKSLRSARLIRRLISRGFLAGGPQ
jgi:hypothetical protein